MNNFIQYARVPPRLRRYYITVYTICRKPNVLYHTSFFFDADIPQSSTLLHVYRVRITEIGASYAGCRFTDFIIVSRGALCMNYYFYKTRTRRFFFEHDQLVF